MTPDQIKRRDELADKEYQPMYINGADVNTSLRIGFHIGYEAGHADAEEELTRKLQVAKAALKVIQYEVYLAESQGQREVNDLLIVEQINAALKELE